MKSMPRWWILVCIGCTLVGVIALVILNLTVNPYVKRRLESSVRENCATCTLDIGDLQVSLLNPGDFLLHEVRFSSGTRGAFETAVRASSIAVHLSLKPLWDRHVNVTQIVSSGLEVTLLDGDKKPPPAEKTTTRGASGKVDESEPSGQTEDSARAPYTFTIQNSIVHHGTLSYTRNHMGTSAHLRVQKIEIELGALGNGKDLKDEPVKGHGEAQVEKSGLVELHVSTYLFRKPLYVDVELFTNDQDLADLTPFFKENAGVNLEGILMKGHGKVKVRGPHLTATLLAEYRGLNIKLDKMYDRNEITAFFMNLGTAVAMGEKNVGKPKSDRQREVELEREEKESIVSFILRGLKEAALKVAKAA